MWSKSTAASCVMTCARARPNTCIYSAHIAVCFNLAGIKDQPEIILCEALIDALTFYQAGYTNVTASYGTNGFTEEHWQVIQQNPIERILIAYDRDEAGHQAANELAKQLTKEYIECYRPTPSPKAWTSMPMACEVKPADKSLAVVIRSAEWDGGWPGATVDSWWFAVGRW